MESFVCQQCGKDSSARRHEVAGLSAAWIACRRPAPLSAVASPRWPSSTNADSSTSLGEVDQDPETEGRVVKFDLGQLLVGCKVVHHIHGDGVPRIDVL